MGGDPAGAGGGGAGRDRMTDEDLDALARDLAGTGEPFVVATVVWRRAPSSGKVGSRAIVTADGRIRGWLGGACAEPAVVAEARRALMEGTARLMFLGRADELAGHQRDGVVSVPIACQSEGALEVYVEPNLPQPHVVVVGRSPAVDALASMASALGWRAVVVDDGGSPGDHPGVANVLTSLDLAAAGVGERSFVVVATQGHYDEQALERALETPAAYVGLIASTKRGEGVLGYLRDRGVSEEQLERVRVPAGLDLGGIEHREMAVAILAQIVQLRAGGDLPSGVAHARASDAHEAVDPICGMAVAVATARYRATFGGQTYYFCSAGCQAQFETDPAAYALA